ncbi:hypothetical protein ANN_11060 [Periplaneta americana]|uniref:DDE-1 domain-containing protein n=1 Tax=Periplaneta americana TaxID=6978 RepID=A0ABQ8T3Z1_PERAM|nr:hypothetical protein ANN_11060 [Periplaneta americana]
MYTIMYIRPEGVKALHGIRQVSIQGEQQSADTSPVSQSVEDLHHEILCRQLALRKAQIYNCDKTGLNWKAFPDKTLTSASERSASEFKQQKERITLIMCSNASSREIKNPSAFKNVNINNLPVCSHSRQNNLSEETILVMDNASCHLNVCLQNHNSNIVCRFLPPNTTSLIQPLDQGVIESVKRRYANYFIQCMIREDSNVNVREFLKKYYIKDAIDNIANAWNDVSRETIEKLE